jgi:uncharacterized protein YcbX
LAGVITIAALYRYPIKSCRGTSLTEAVLDARGIVGDRRLMLVDQEGEFLTQRELPRMALIVPLLEGDDLVVRAPGLPDLQLRPANDGPRVEVTVWKDLCAAVDQGDDAAQWFRAFLDVPCRLVRLADDHVRRVDPGYARRPGDQTAFTDGYPLLLASEASLEDLNRRMLAALPMNRFRPSLVVRGCAPYAEDAWRTIRAGTMDLDVVKPCVRCVITTTDQDSAEFGLEPLRTLATYRKGPDGGVWFGQNLIHHRPGTLRVGDLVEILEPAP